MNLKAWYWSTLVFSPQRLKHDGHWTMPNLGVVPSSAIYLPGGLGSAWVGAKEATHWSKKGDCWGVLAFDSSQSIRACGILCMELDNAAVRVDQTVLSRLGRKSHIVVDPWFAALIQSHILLAGPGKSPGTVLAGESFWPGRTWWNIWYRYTHFGS